jgi:hypothetical protein
MNKILAVILALIICLLPATVFAEETNTEQNAAATPTNSIQPADQPSPDGGAGQQAQGVFYLDNQNVYDGMDKAYQSGYTPYVGNGTAVIVFPVLTSAGLKDNKLTVIPNLGEPGTSPFVFTNYQKDITLAAQPVNGGSGVVNCYLVRFDLALSGGRVNGSYPVIVDVKGQLADGTEVTASFTAYVTITDGIDPNAPEPTPTPPATETPTSEPKIIVSGYSMDPAEIAAGQEFSASIELKNTSDIKSVQNMTVTVSSDCPTLSFTDATNTYYFEKVKKEGTVQLTLHLKADIATAPGRYHILLAIEYDNNEAKTLSASGSAEVAIVQPVRVELDPPAIAKEMNAGDTFPLQLNVMNLGRGKVYNIRCTLDAPGLITSGSTFIGNLDAGSAGQGTMSIFAGTMDMTGGDTGSGKYGLSKGTITLVYEDENGKEYTQNYDVSTTIKEAAVQTSAQQPEEKPESASEWWISLLIGGGIFGGLAAVLLVRKKRRTVYDEKS